VRGSDIAIARTSSTVATAQSPRTRSALAWKTSSSTD